MHAHLPSQAPAPSDGISDVEGQLSSRAGPGLGSDTWPGAGACWATLLHTASEKLALPVNLTPLPHQGSGGTLRNLAWLLLSHPLCFKFPACPAPSLLLPREPPPAAGPDAPSRYILFIPPQLLHNPCPKPFPAVSHLISFLGRIIIYGGRRRKIPRAKNTARNSV